MPDHAAEKLMPVEEFLSFEDGTDTRYELVDGHLRAMAPPSEAHGTVVVNLGAALKRHLPPGCRVVAEAGIRPPAGSDWNYWQADLIVTCTGRARDGQGLSAPVLVVEVLSPSTMDHDRGRKVPGYTTLPSVRDILLVGSEDRWVQHWSRQADGWFVRDVIGQGEVLPACLNGAAITLDDLYEGV
ncbi:MAG: hypothetical protein RLY86_2553 [Pseudomonadota bacterium]|jgi:Uma2 family endonuclease